MFHFSGPDGFLMVDEKGFLKKCMHRSVTAEEPTQILTLQETINFRDTLCRFTTVVLIMLSFLR